MLTSMVSGLFSHQKFPNAQFPNSKLSGGWLVADVIHTCVCVYIYTCIYIYTYNSGFYFYDHDISLDHRIPDKTFHIHSDYTSSALKIELAMQEWWK